MSEIIKVYGPTKIRAWTFCLRNFCPLRTAENIYLKLKIFGKNTLEKKKNDPIEWFFYILKYVAKTRKKQKVYYIKQL